jgi:hypothetical protein
MFKNKILFAIKNVNFNKVRKIAKNAFLESTIFISIDSNIFSLSSFLDQGHGTQNHFHSSDRVCFWHCDIDAIYRDSLAPEGIGHDTWNATKLHNVIQHHATEGREISPDFLGLEIPHTMT